MKGKVSWDIFISPLVTVPLLEVAWEDYSVKLSWRSERPITYGSHGWPSEEQVLIEVRRESEYYLEVPFPSLQK